MSFHLSSCLYTSVGPPKVSCALLRKKSGERGSCTASVRKLDDLTVLRCLQESASSRPMPLSPYLCISVQRFGQLLFASTEPGVYVATTSTSPLVRPPPPSPPPPLVPLPLRSLPSLPPPPLPCAVLFCGSFVVKGQSWRGLRQNGVRASETRHC